MEFISWQLKFSDNWLYVCACGDDKLMNECFSVITGLEKNECLKIYTCTLICIGMMIYGFICFHDIEFFIFTKSNIHKIRRYVILLTRSLQDSVKYNLRNK